jgi:RNA polymerase sigma-70 factor, ECF subfamily
MIDFTLEALLLKIELTFARIFSRSLQTHNLSDIELARFVLNGDKNAWEMFYVRYSNWCYRFAYWHLNANLADAEDLCSEILIEAARNIGSYQASKGDLDGWMHGLAQNQLAHFCKKRNRGNQVLPELKDTISVSFTQKVETKQAVNQALASLPQKQAAALIEKYVKGYSTEELAKRNGTSLKAAESLLTRARGSFKNAYGKISGSDLDGENK